MGLHVPRAITGPEDRTDGMSGRNVRVVPAEIAGAEALRTDQKERKSAGDIQSREPEDGME